MQAEDKGEKKESMYRVGSWVKSFVGRSTDVGGAVKKIRRTALIVNFVQNRVGKERRHVPVP